MLSGPGNDRDRRTVQLMNLASVMLFIAIVATAILWGVVGNDSGKTVWFSLPKGWFCRALHSSITHGPAIPVISRIFHKRCMPPPQNDRVSVRHGSPGVALMRIPAASREVVSLISVVS
jgi:hypothetical protein